MFSEIEQENIINEFLNTIYVNDMCKIMKNKIKNCPCKLEDDKVELSKLNLPHNIINNICKFNYNECQDCKGLRKLPQIVERENKSKAIDKLTFMFSKCYFFPDVKDLRNEFNFSVRKISCLKQIYQKIKNNNIDMVFEIVKCEKNNLDKTIAHFNKVIKFMYDNAEHCRHYRCSFVECPVFKIPSDYFVEA
jgi:hypothetical protein